MKIENGSLPGLSLISADPFVDNRGFLCRTYDRDMFAEAGLTATWLQESRSMTEKKGTLRGLHIMLPPYVEGKLIQIVHGTMLWMVVDLRSSSPTFGQWEGVELDGDKNMSLYVEPGFAHGCVSLSDMADLIIKSDQNHRPDSVTGILWNDQQLNVDWHLHGKKPLVSEAHLAYPSYQQFLDTYGSLDGTNDD